VNCLIAPPRNILTYLLTYLSGSGSPTPLARTSHKNIKKKHKVHLKTGLVGRPCQWSVNDV